MCTLQHPPTQSHQLYRYFSKLPENRSVYTKSCVAEHSDSTFYREPPPPVTRSILMAKRLAPLNSFHNCWSSRIPVLYVRNFNELFGGRTNQLHCACQSQWSDLVKNRNAHAQSSCKWLNIHSAVPSRRIRPRKRTWSFHFPPFTRVWLCVCVRGNESLNE